MDEQTEELLVATNLEAMAFPSEVAKMLADPVIIGSRPYYRFTPEFFAWVLARLAKMESQWWNAAAAGNRAAEAAALHEQLATAAQRLSPLWDWAETRFAGMQDLPGQPRPTAGCWRLPATPDLPGAGELCDAYAIEHPPNGGRNSGCTPKRSQNVTEGARKAAPKDVVATRRRKRAASPLF